MLILNTRKKGVLLSTI